ncbi:MAG: hypothetical protein ACYCSF_12865 [Acidimicrobiales bacterium]
MAVRQASAEDPAASPSSAACAPTGAACTGAPTSPSRSRWYSRSRFAVLGPVALVTVQVVVNFFDLQLPAALVAKHGNRNPFAYHNYLSSRATYSDLYTLYWHHHLYTHPLPYLDVRIEYPVVLGIYMTAAAALTHGVRAYFALSSLGLYACAVGSVCCLWSASKRAAWIFSVCPLLFVFSLLNWDLLAIFLMLLGWRAWTRDRYGQAAVWLTLGTFAKLYPLFLLLYYAVALLRRWRAGNVSTRVAARFLLIVLGVAAVVNVPFIILAPRKWAYFFVLNDGRNQYVSIVYWLHLISPSDSLATANNVFAAVVSVAALAGVYVAWRGVAPARIAAVVFAVFLLMQKVYSPQYTLWLIPFALMAEWEFWTVVALSMVGLSNYSSAAVNIYLRSHGPRAAQWFARNIEPLNRDLRLSVILVVALAAVIGPKQRDRMFRGQGTDQPTGVLQPEL